VLTPTRISSVSPCVSARPVFSSSKALRIPRAARTARAGSSSWAVGTPKAAITASPMNFSTVPPSASMAPRMVAK